MIPNRLPSEVVAIGGVIDPDANTANTYTSDYLDMADFEAAMAIGLAGDLGSSATVTYSIVQATSSGGAGVKAISGKTATVFTQSPADSNKQVVINVRGDELDVANSFRYVAVRMVVATATSDTAALICGLWPKHGPADDNDLASVDEIVN